jgi:uncharacterized membrane protein YheB (UPF0754 family)
MKKTVFLALMVCGLVTSFLVENSMSQAPESFPDKKGVNFFRKFYPEAFTVKSTSNGDGALEKLQSQLLKLTRQRIKTMREEELKAEITRLNQQLQEQIAEVKLQQANEILRQIVKAFPESQAAKRAAAMLKVPMGGAVPGLGGGRGEAGPGWVFGRPKPERGGRGPQF